uniref:Uncharacterized protein n=1 Tax=Glossina brevipalpis TaxID=37001 RepID=A0A1A9VZX5_9MUSC
MQNEFLKYQQHLKRILARIYGESFKLLLLLLFSAFSMASMYLSNECVNMFVKEHIVLHASFCHRKAAALKKRVAIFNFYIKHFNSTDRIFAAKPPSTLTTENLTKIYCVHLGNRKINTPRLFV